MLPPFRLERHFARWEFQARHHLTASDAETITLDELLSLGSDDDRRDFHGLRLGYTEPSGAPELRAAIAATYENRSPDDIHCFAGAEEGIFATLSALLDRDCHAIVVLPTYQSLETVPASIGAVTGVMLDPAQGWLLDVDRVAAALRPNTRAVIINFPNNPTGALPSAEVLSELVRLCDRHGIYLFSDEAYRPLGPLGGRQLPQVADLYERGISLGVMSKAYGLPGLRIGWIATPDRRVLKAAGDLKHYLSICNASTSERLAIIALRARAELLRRNCAIVSESIALWDDFFARWPHLFEWSPPTAGCVCYPRYLGADGVEAFARELVETAGVLVLPASIFASSFGELPADRFRIGAGRLGLGQGLREFERFLQQRSA